MFSKLLDLRANLEFISPALILSSSLSYDEFAVSFRSPKLPQFSTLKLSTYVSCTVHKLWVSICAVFGWLLPLTYLSENMLLLVSSSVTNIAMFELFCNEAFDFSFRFRILVLFWIFAINLFKLWSLKQNRRQ